MSRFRWYGPTLVLLVTTLGLMFATPALIRTVTWAGTNATITTIRNDLDANTSLVELSDAFTQVARAVEPSVVHIEIESRAARDRVMRWRSEPETRPDTGPDIPEEFRDFFERFGDPRAPLPERDLAPRSPDSDDYDRFNSFEPVANGSGWVYRHEGSDQSGNYVVTNAHVVRDVGSTERIKVTFQDRREAYATVVGADDKTDVAVLRLQGDDAYLHPAALTSERVEQGEIVFAFGSPFGASFSFSMSQGIVSAVGRRMGIIGRDSYENFIQTDAAINPGNSGGPLVNTRGQIVGMNTAIASRTGTNSGLGFAIPVSLATNIADRLITQGEVRRGFLGVEIAEVDADIARAFGYGGDGGVLIQDLIPGGAAQDAGLEPGDIVTGVDGTPIASVRELRFLVADLPPGQDVELAVFRSGKSVDLVVTLGSRDTLLASGRPAGSAPDRRGSPDAAPTDDERLLRLGIIGVEAFDESEARRGNVEHLPGVLITGVRPGSVAANLPAPLTRGTIVTHVFDTPVSTVGDLIKAVNKANPDAPLRLTVNIWDPREERYRQRYAILSLD